MSDNDIKHIKGLLAGILVISLVMMGALLHPIIGAVYSWIAVVVTAFWTVYQAEKFW